MFDNREIAVLVWLAILAGWSLSQPAVRKSLLEVVWAALAWKIVLVVSMAAVYVVAAVLGLWRLGFWSFDNLKGTVIWFISAGFVMVMEVALIEEDKRFFQKAVRDGVRITVVLEFVVALHPLPLILELVVVPIAALLGAVAVYAESREQSKQVARFVKGMMAVLGLALVVYTMEWVWSEFGSLAERTLLVEFLLPILLTLLFLPFLYVMAAVVSYEGLFVRLQFFIDEPGLRRFTKIRLIGRFGLNFRGLNGWWRRFVEERPRNREEIVASLEKEKAR